jgi:hypothetical protein
MGWAAGHGLVRLGGCGAVQARRRNSWTAVAQGLRASSPQLACMCCTAAMASSRGLMACGEHRITAHVTRGTRHAGRSPGQEIARGRAGSCDSALLPAKAWEDSNGGCVESCVSQGVVSRRFSPCAAAQNGTSCRTPGAVTEQRAMVRAKGARAAAGSTRVQCGPCGRQESLNDRSTAGARTLRLHATMPPVPMQGCESATSTLGCGAAGAEELGQVCLARARGSVFGTGTPAHQYSGPAFSASRCPFATSSSMPTPSTCRPHDVTTRLTARHDTVTTYERLRSTSRHTARPVTPAVPGHALHCLLPALR